MSDAPPSASSRTALTAILIGGATLLLVAAIIGLPYLSARSENRRTVEFGARARPVLDRLIDAERAYKERTGKFWRDQRDALSPDATKQALNVDVASTPDCRFEVYPADLAADPTLRVAAKGTGPSEGIVIECVYDAIAHTKSCQGE
jgi:hypothetical protein